MTNNFKLFCLVDGEFASSVFPVKASADDSIGDLKKLIKVEKPIDFKDIDADKLTLWHVSIPVVASDKNTPIVLSKIDSKTELLPTDELSDVIKGTPPKKTIHILVERRIKEVDPNVSTTFNITVEGTQVALSWETSPTQASLVDLHDQLRVKCGINDNERRLVKIVHHQSFADGSVVEHLTEPGLRTILKMYLKHGITDVVVRFEFARMGHSNFSMENVYLRIGTETIAEFEVGRTRHTTEKYGDVMRKLRGALDLVRESTPHSNEGCTTRYVGPFMQAAVVLNPNLCLVPEREVSGRWGNGPVDYGVELRDPPGLYVMGVAEVKKTEKLVNGLPQNIIQLDSTITGFQGRGHRSQGIPWVSYGVVTDGKQWQFVKYTLGPMEGTGAPRPNPSVCMTKLPLVVNYIDDEKWWAQAEEVFEHLLWLVENMAEGRPSEDVSKRSRIEERVEERVEEKVEKREE